MLGLGRALGETMAVTFVIGNAHRVSSPILAPGTTISATIANEAAVSGRHDHRRAVGGCRVSGQTAPLLFTALNNLDLNAPMASLPVVIFQFALRLSSYQDWQRLAWIGALMITLSVLALSIIARALAASRTSP